MKNPLRTREIKESKSKRLNIELSEDELIDLKRRALDAKMSLREYIKREMKIGVAKVACFLMLFALPVFAADKGKEQTFDYPKQDVWQACIKAASQEFTLDYSDRESGVLSFSTGISLTSNGFKNSVTVKELSPEKTSVSLNTQKKKQLWAMGAGGRISEKYFKAVEKILRADK